MNKKPHYNFPCRCELQESETVKIDRELQPDGTKRSGNICPVHGDFSYGRTSRCVGYGNKECPDKKELFCKSQGHLRKRCPECRRLNHNLNMKIKNRKAKGLKFAMLSAQTSKCIEFNVKCNQCVLVHPYYHCKMYKEAI